MPRARNIKPGFFESEDPARVGFPQRLLWIALWTLADRSGRLERRPVMFKKYAFGYDSVTLADVEGWIGDLIEAKLLLPYSVEGRDYLEVSNFSKHQHPHPKEPISTIPSMHEGKAVELHGNTPMHDVRAVEKNGKDVMHGPRAVELHGKGAMQGGQAGLIVDSGLLIVDCGEPEPVPSALARLPRPPHQALPLDQDPQSDLRQLAKYLVQQLPAAGDAHLTYKALERDFGHSVTFAGDSERYAASVRERARIWCAAWNENPSLTVKKSQYWIGDGDYARNPPPPRQRYGGMTRLIDLFPEVPNASE